MATDLAVGAQRGWCAVNLRRVVSEPLVHFVLGGALLFGVDAWRRGRARAEVTVSAAEVRALREVVRSRTNREPTREELEAAVRARVDEALLVEEARARGIDRGDPEVRRRLAARMRAVLRAEVPPRAPDRSELERFLRENAARYQRPPRVEFDERFLRPAEPDWSYRVEGDLARYQAIVDAGGDLPWRDPPPRCLSCSPRTEAALASEFDPDFAAKVMAIPDGARRVIATRYGYYLLRVRRRVHPGAMSIEEASPRLMEDWRAAQRDALDAAALARLRRGARVVVRWPDAR